MKAINIQSNEITCPHYTVHADCFYCPQLSFDCVLQYVIVCRLSLNLFFNAFPLLYLQIAYLKISVLHSIFFEIVFVLHIRATVSVQAPIRLPLALKPTRPPLLLLPLQPAWPNTGLPLKPTREFGIFTFFADSGVPCVS